MNKYKTECVLICLSPSPTNSRVIHAAAKMAGAFNAELTAFFVETPVYDKISEQEKIQLDTNKKLAEKSGAKVASSYGSDVAMQIAEYARACGATKIVIGRTNQKRKWAFPRNDIPRRLSQLVPELEIYIIPCYTPAYFAEEKDRTVVFSWHSVFITLGLLLAATLTGLFLKKSGVHRSKYYNGLYFIRTAGLFSDRRLCLWHYSLNTQRAFI